MCQQRFEWFLKERSEIHKDIEAFLLMVLEYCLKMEELAKKRYTINVYADKMSDNLISLLKSLCFIHALYGYPQANSDET
ncbi:Hypothetical predicted protein, partial [Paramuricea clavata]